MIDASEKLISLAAAGRLVAVDGRAVPVATVRQWTRTGVGGAVLESVDVGRRRCTSVEAVQRFLGRGHRRRELPANCGMTVITRHDETRAARVEAALAAEGI